MIGSDQPDDPLYEIAQFGNPWHGLIWDQQLRLPPGQTKAVLYDMTAMFASFTYLVDFGMPEPTTPAEIVAQGGRFESDAVLFSASRMLSPIGTDSVGSNAWLYRCADGTVYRMVVEAVITQATEYNPIFDTYTTEVGDTLGVRFTVTAQKFGTAPASEALSGRACLQEMLFPFTAGVVDTGFLYVPWGHTGSVLAPEERLEPAPDGSFCLWHLYPWGRNIQGSYMWAASDTNSAGYIVRMAGSGGSRTELPRVTLSIERDLVQCGPTAIHTDIGTHNPDDYVQTTTRIKLYRCIVSRGNGVADLGRRTIHVIERTASGTFDPIHDLIRDTRQMLRGGGVVREFSVQAVRDSQVTSFTPSVFTVAYSVSDSEGYSWSASYNQDTWPGSDPPEWNDRPTADDIPITNNLVLMFYFGVDQIGILAHQHSNGTGGALTFPDQQPGLIGNIVGSYNPRTNEVVLRELPQNGVNLFSAVAFV